jgi:hypothetical protein
VVHRAVVAHDQVALGVDAGDQLLQLQAEQPAVGAQLEHVVLDLRMDAGDHLQPLHDRGDVAHGDQVLDLERRQGAGDLVEAELVALERGQSLVRAAQDRPRVLHDVAHRADVEGDDLHRLRHRDHRHAGLAGDPVRRAVSRAGLVGLDAGVGHQVDSCPQDPARVLVEDDRAVHLRQLPYARGAERDVEGEAAGGDRLHHPVVSQHDERAGPPTQDPLQALAEHGPRCDAGHGGAHRHLFGGAVTAGRRGCHVESPC